jgi:hypothetical protein
MAYQDIITIDQAKAYLRIDDGMSADDMFVGIMINTAFQYIEQFTNVICVAVDKVYRYDENKEVRVYDFPINTEILPSGVDVEYNDLYEIYYSDFGSDIESVSLNVGYELATDVPNDLVVVAYEIIDVLYYGKETGKSIDDLSPMAMQILWSNKRFML